MVSGHPQDEIRENSSAESTIDPADQSPASGQTKSAVRSPSQDRVGTRALKETLKDALVEAQKELSSGQESNGESDGSSQANILHRLDELTTLVEMLSNKVEQNQSAVMEVLSALPDSESDSSVEDSTFDWQAQKEALLRNIEGASPPSEKPKVDAKKESPPPPTAETKSPAEPPATESPQAMEPDEIADLRAKLEEKLRRAEIDISIERAKIARVRQELDEQRTELRREITRQMEDATESNDEGKVSRWKRFLAFTGNDSEQPESDSSDS